MALGRSIRRSTGPLPRRRPLPAEQLAYVVAFDRAAQKNDALTAIDVNPETAFPS